MTDKLRDNRSRGWYWINNEVIDEYRLTPYEMMVYNILCRHADERGHSFPGISRIMELGSMSKPQVIRSIKRLEELGLLAVKRDEKPTEGETRQRGVNHYYLQSVKSGGVVSDIYYPSKPQTLGVVSDVDHNNTHSEQDPMKGAANAAQPTAPKKERKRDVIFDAIAVHLFGITGDANGTGARIAKVAKRLKELEPAHDAAQLSSDVHSFAMWYARKYPTIDKPRDPEKVAEHWQAWRAGNHTGDAFTAELRRRHIEEWRPA